jgi:hypothetical protein
MTDRTYNGWRTYETWLVALWLDNDRSSYEYWREAAREVAAEVENPQAAVLVLADRVKAEHSEGAYIRMSSNADVYSDLINAALSEVDWEEIARHLLA